MIKTSFIVLRRTPFRETGLVIAGLSPDCGRVDLLVKGARSIGRKKFPVYELFRELSIQFNESKDGSLVSPRSVEPLGDSDGIAQYPEAYLAACDYASFILRHSRQMLGCPDSYASLRKLLERLSTNTCGTAKAIALAKLSFLQEAGLVPEGKQQDLLPELLASATGEAPMPEFEDDYWRRLAKWVESLAAYHGLK